MVRAAAKNFRDVLVVVDPADYPQVLAALDAPGGASRAFRFDLARKAFAHTAAYDAAIAGTLGTIESTAATSPAGAGRRCAAAALRPRPAEGARLSATARTRIRRPRGTPTAAEGFGAVQILQGKELSFTNLLDLDSRARIVLEFSEPAATVIKHTNPCGAATGTSPQTPTSARARPTRSPPSAASSG
jgi:phosphoribosylaminoimidazolecarboxamide formyltransferase/IMP cyclohydrolase